MKKWIALCIISIVCIATAIFVVGTLKNWADKCATVVRLRQICLGLSNYRDNNLLFARDRGYPHSEVFYEGNSIGSWRYALLPYLASYGNELNVITTTPWQNTRFADVPTKNGLDFYRFTNHVNDEGYPTTNILAVIGPDTVFDSEVPGYFPNSILLLAVGDTQIPWGMPGDFEVDEHGNPVNEWPPPLFDSWYGVVLGGGDIYLLDGKIPKEKLQPFLTKTNAKNLNPEKEWERYILTKSQVWPDNH